MNITPKVEWFDGIEAMWYHALQLCLQFGQSLDSRNGQSKEWLGYSSRLRKPMANVLLNPVRDASPIYGAGEFMWYMTSLVSERADGDQIVAYASTYKNYLEEDGIAYGGYGERWGAQFQYLLMLLEACPNTRQAILTMWRANDVEEAVGGHRKDLPCTLSLQFLIRDNRLHCICTMRSQDVWMGMPYDIFCFTTLQCLLAEHLGIEVGIYQHNIGSLHLYEKHYDEAERVIPKPDETEIKFSESRIRILDFIKNAVDIEYQIRNNEVFHLLKASNRWNFLLALCAMNFYDDHDYSYLMPDEVWKHSKRWEKKLARRRERRSDKSSILPGISD